MRLVTITFVHWLGISILKFGRFAREYLTPLVLTEGKNALIPIIFYISSKPLAQSSWNFQYLLYHLVWSRKSKILFFVNSTGYSHFANGCKQNFYFLISKELYCFYWFACYLFDIRMFIYVYIWLFIIWPHPFTLLGGI